MKITLAEFRVTQAETRRAANSKRPTCDLRSFDTPLPRSVHYLKPIGFQKN